MDARARGALPAIAGGTLALGVMGVYVAILAAEGEGDLKAPRVVALASLLGVSGLVLVLAWLAPNADLRYGALLGAAVALSGWAILASLSIGLLLVPSAVLAWVTALGEGRAIGTGTRRRVAAAAVPLGVAAVVLALLLPA